MSRSSPIEYLKIALFLFVIATSLNAAGFGLLPEELPEDERTAVMELEEGTLDSATWEMLKPFYIQPLSVTLGELRYLRDIFPGLPDDLPTEHEVLSLYEPWTDDNIAVFFKDYPYLVPFKPVLSFAAERMPSFAHVAFSSRRSGFSDMFRQSVRFTVTPNKNIRGDGTVYFQDNYARWQRRRVMLRIPHVGRVHLGNFSLTLNNGLFYGYFPSPSTSHEALRDNWLYGESRTWNGFSSETPVGKKNIISSLVHIRETEKVAGLKAEFNPGAAVSLYGAFSGAVSQLDGSDHDTSLAVHGGVELSMGSVKITLESGTGLFNAGSVPVYLTLNNGKRKHRYSFSFITIPENFTAPRSSLLYSFCNRLETSDSTKNDIMGIDISYSGPLYGYVKQTFHTSYIAMENSADLRTSWKITGVVPFTYSIYYGLNIYDLYNNLKHRIKVFTAHTIGPHVTISPLFSYDIRPYEYWRLTANLYTGFKVFSIMTVSPFLSFNTNSKAHRNFACGIIQRIAFFEKTFGELQLTVPVISYNNEKYSFYAKTHFLF